MNLLELFNDGILELPLEREKDVSFVEFIDNLFDNFYDKILDVEWSTFYPDEEKNKIQELITGIKKTIKLYLDGSPNNAYSELKKTLDSTSVYNFLLYDKINTGANFYRLRVKEQNYPLHKRELFHIPFHLRHLIGTQRYSINGFPCLYLSNSIYVAWEEMRRPNLNSIQAMLLRTENEIQYLDLTTDYYTRKFDSNTIGESVLIQQLITWPLKAACSIKVLEDKAVFKPEYILPQLLLQWLRNENKQDAIMFSSTHINLNQKQSEGKFCNLVLPVKTNENYGYCGELYNMFTLTDVVSWQLYQIGLSGQTFLYNNDKINPEIEKIEVIPGMTYPYNYSPLASLERMLMFMPVNKLDD